MGKLVLPCHGTELHTGIEPGAIRLDHVLQIDRFPGAVLLHLIFRQLDTCYHAVLRTIYCLSRIGDESVGLLVQADELFLGSILALDN